MQNDDFLGHPEGSSLGHRMVLLAYLEVAPGGPGEVGGHVGKP